MGRPVYSLRRITTVQKPRLFSRQRLNSLSKAILCSRLQSLEVITELKSALQHDGPQGDIMYSKYSKLFHAHR